MNVNRLCDDFFEGLIDFAIGSGLGFEPKPNPEMVYECIRQLGVEVQDCIFVGDSESDTRTAKKVGIKCIGVLWGFRDRETLEKECADYIVNSAEEIFDIVKGT